MPSPRRNVRSTPDGGSAVQPPGLSCTAYWEALCCALCLITTPEISSTGPVRDRGFCPGSHRPRARDPLVVWAWDFLSCSFLAAVSRPLLSHCFSLCDLPLFSFSRAIGNPPLSLPGVRGHLYLSPVCIHASVPACGMRGLVLRVVPSTPRDFQGTVNMTSLIEKCCLGFPGSVRGQFLQRRNLRPFSIFILHGVVRWWLGQSDSVQLEPDFSGYGSEAGPNSWIMCSKKRDLSC